MKKAFLDWSLSLIKKKNPNLGEIKMLKIKYGLEGLYLTMTKFIILLLISFLLGMVKEFIIFCFLYNGVRLFAFGLHVSKSYICLIISMGLFIIIPYLSQMITIPFYIKVILSTLCITLIMLYAPADTHKRPLIRKKKRSIYKILSILISVIYIILSLTLKNNFLSNSLILSLLVEVILILPITYKLFRLPYNNYKNYRSL